jgi:DNA-directed RNA polymerase subunit RPC12/RpoP
MINLCKLIGHKRDTLIFVDDDRKYVIIDQSDCIRCGKPYKNEPIALNAQRDPKQGTRLLPCPLCGSKVHLTGTDCYPEEGIEVECSSSNCEYGVSVAVHGCDPTPSLKPIAIKTHNILWGDKC